MKNLKTDNSPLLLKRPGRPGLYAILAALTLLIFPTACYEPIEGCLDPNSLNFGLDADRECDGCCIYPNLSVRFVHRWSDSDTSFTLNYAGQAYKDGGGHPFAIDRITYYVNNFTLVRPDGELVYTNDSVLVQRLNAGGVSEQAYIRDDYLLVNAVGTAVLPVGALWQNGAVEQLRFQLGLPESLDRIFPESLPDNHPLSLLDSSMYRPAESRYLSNRLDLRRDTAANAEDLLLSYGTERMIIPISLDLPAFFSLPPGYNVQFTISANYAQWFASVQAIDTDPEADIVSEIVANLSNSFELLEIRVSRQ